MEQVEHTKLVRLARGTIEFLNLFSAFLMVLLTIVVFSEVLSRYVFNFPLVFSSELTQLIFPWLIFLGNISVTKDDDHLSITFFRELMPKWAQKFSFLLAKLIILYFSFYMVKSSYEIAQVVSDQAMPMLRISKEWLYYSVTASFIGILIVVIIQIILILTNKLEPPREGGIAE